MVRGGAFRACSLVCPDQAGVAGHVGGEDGGEAAYREGAFSGDTQRGFTLKNFPPLPIRSGEHALWFDRKSYRHWRTEPVLPDAVVAPGARTTARWRIPNFGLQNSSIATA